MVKKGYNWKSRQVVKTIVDNSTTKEIQLDFNVEGHYDPSNALVLPSKKRKTKIKDDKPKITRILSKKRRKLLEKVVAKKEKKQNRASLLEALSQVQIAPEDLSKLTSISNIQTKGLKRHFQEELFPNKAKKPKSDPGKVTLNTIKGANKKRQLLNVLTQETTCNDPNVVGFYSSSGESEDDDEEDVAAPAPESIPSEIKHEEEIKEETCEIVEPPLQAPVKKPAKMKVKKSKAESKPAVFVDVIRDDKIQAARLKLPILAEEQQIMEAINENPIIILAGETGSGKTTQVPQFLYEAGYALTKQIAVTEPRRVAAISMSQRVAVEMNLSHREVSYLIRFEGNVSDETKIKFMTDGVLLKEIQNDFLLSKYSVVILDEAHERSVYTDILIGFLSRIVPLRQKRGDPLKLIIMSATLKLEDFTLNKKLFKMTPPVLNVQTRQFPVTVHFNKRTYDDYLKECFRKAVKIHTKLPDGGILIFLTGKQEVDSLVRKLRKAFPLRTKNRATIEDEDEEIDQLLDQVLKKNKKKQKKIVMPKIDLDDYSVQEDEDVDLSESDSDEEIAVVSNAKPLWVLPLYSMLPTHKQAEVFNPPPAGCRLCIVSTNVAETSLTIPGVKYVVDTGKTKVKLYDKTTGVNSYAVTWTSKASANQRAGRAGRLGPGHCYRLYSSAVFNDTFQEFSLPEIQQKPLDDVILQMKCMRFGKIFNFPFPTAPDMTQLETAEKLLEILGALKQSKVTDLGKAIAKFPVSPRFGKMLAFSHQHNLMPYAILLVAALSVQEVLLETPISEGADEIKRVRQKWGAVRRQWAGTGQSLLLGDNMVLLRAVGAALYANSQHKLGRFCAENGLREKAVVEIIKLMMQLTNSINSIFDMPENELVVDPKLPPPSEIQLKLLRQILLAGSGDRIARKIPRDEIADKVKHKYAYRANNMEEPVYLHSSSVLRKTLPEFVVYQEIYETNKMYMRGVTAIEPEWLPVYVPSLCNLGEPLPDCEPRYNPESGKVNCYVTGTFGPQAWELPRIEMEHPQNINYFKWFGKFLLEGKVFKKLEKYTKMLLSQPAIMVKSWAKLQPRTDALLKALISRDVSNKAKLEEIWGELPKFLLREFLMWLPESMHAEVTLLWPPQE